jgi:hypothetical protein
MKQHDASILWDAKKIFLWTALVPVLACWPFISAFPAFSLLNGVASSWHAALQVMFFATGFWGFLSVALAVMSLINPAARGAWRATRKERGLQIAVYAMVWTIAYAASAFIMR